MRYKGKGNPSRREGSLGWLIPQQPPARDPKSIYRQRVSVSEYYCLSRILSHAHEGRRARFFRPLFHVIHSMEPSPLLLQEPCCVYFFRTVLQEERPQKCISAG